MNKKTKKILLSFGIAISTAIPITTIISCGDKKPTNKTTKKETTKKEYVIPTLRQMNLDKDSISEILKIDKNASKEDAIKKIEQIIVNKPQYKKRYIDFVKNQDSWKTAYYLIKHLQATTNLLNISRAIMSLDIKHSSKTEKQKTKFLIDKILKGKLSISSIIENFKNKMSGKDDDFQKVMVTSVVSIENKQIIIKNNLFWGWTRDAMGGEDVVKYIFETKGGYKIVNPKS